ncbi:MAG TPA: dihydrolipoyl dehydrogenase [Candidatus Dormibacteraeota bacterium]|jgi:dihydrolipoamide dehydrogenase
MVADDAPRVVVLGGGPAGDVAALRASQLGARVVMVERAELGGTCLNWGCIPTKSLLATADLLRRIRGAGDLGIEVGDVRVDFTRMMERKEEVVLAMRRGVENACKRRRVEVVRGEGRLEDGAVAVDGRRIEYDHLVVCVGTEPSGLPGLDMDHPSVVTSNGVLRLDRVPERLLVVGGGVIGCEFASVFAPLGTSIDVVEVLPEILAGVDPRIVTQFRKLMEKQGIRFHTGRRLEGIAEYRAEDLTARLDDGTEIAADVLLVSVGRRAETRGIGLEEAGVEVNERGHVVVDDWLHTANPRIWAAGDCIGGLQLAHLASKEAERAVENALGHHPRPIDRTVVPSCIYTHPEIAMVGLNSQSAKAAGFTVKTGQARFLGNGKALGEAEPDGLAQLYADAQSDLLLGATIMGVHAVEIVHEVAVAISDGLTMAELGDIIHAHPTVSEVVMDGAEQGEGVAPYLS